MRHRRAVRLDRRGTVCPTPSLATLSGLTSASPARTFLESKPLSGCISLPKDKYENIASLHLLNGAGRDGFRAIAATASCASRRAIGFGDGQRLHRQLLGRPDSPKDGEKTPWPSWDRD